MALHSSMGGYLIVRLIDEDSDAVRDIVVPDFWYHEGFCRIPSSGLESKAENKEMFKASWPSFEVKLLSMHKTYAAARERNLAGALESESAVAHMANLKKPRRRVAAIREEDSPDELADRRPNDVGRKRQPTRQPTLLAPPTPTPPPKLLKRVAEVRPFVQEVDFADPAEDTGDNFTPLPFYEAETQQTLLELNSTSDEEDASDFEALVEEETDSPPPASPATIRRFIALHRSSPSSAFVPPKSTGYSESMPQSSGPSSSGHSGSSSTLNGPSSGHSGSSSTLNGPSSSGDSGSSSSFKGPSSSGHSGSSSSFKGPSSSGNSGSTNNLKGKGPSSAKHSEEVEYQTAKSSGSSMGDGSYTGAGMSTGEETSKVPGISTGAGKFKGVKSSNGAGSSGCGDLSKSKLAKVFAENTPRCPISNCSDGHKQTHNYQRAMGRLVISFSAEMNRRFENMEKRISSSSVANPEIHPSFQAARYNMPLPDPEAFFDFEKKLKNDPSVRQNLVAAIRGFGGKDYKSAMKIAWKECASDHLLSLGTWTGQTKAGTNKDKALKFMDSELEKTINNAVKFGPVNGDVTIDKLQDVSNKWVLKAKERLGKPAPAASTNSADNTSKK